MAQGELAGFTAAITADRRRDEQAVLLRRFGLEVLMFPLLRTSPADLGVLRVLTEQVMAGPPDMFLANTGYGMRAWFALAEGWGLLDGLVAAMADGPVIGARGAKALGELRKAGLDAVYRAPGETLEELVAWAMAQGVAGKRVLLQLHGEPSGPVVGALSEAGASVMCAPVYRMGAGGHSVAHELTDAVLGGRADVVTFTAAPQVEVLADAAQERSLLGPLLERFNSGQVTAACIGPVCAAGAREAGIREPLVPEHARLGSLATAIAATLAGRELRPRHPTAPAGTGRR
jgi:uroporphyrinogen-III synthase